MDVRAYISKIKADADAETRRRKTERLREKMAVLEASLLEDGIRLNAANEIEHYCDECHAWKKAVRTNSFGAYHELECGHVA